MWTAVAGPELGASHHCQYKQGGCGPDVTGSCLSSDKQTVKALEENEGKYIRN